MPNQQESINFYPCGWKTQQHQLHTLGHPEVQKAAVWHTIKSKEQNLSRNHAIIHPKMHLFQKYKRPIPIRKLMHSPTCINITCDWLGQPPTYCPCSATHRLTNPSFNIKYRWSPVGRVEVTACVDYLCIFTCIYSTCSSKLFLNFNSTQKSEFSRNSVQYPIK